MIDVSVVIPIYNHEKYLEHAIRSVMAQKINFQMEVLIGEDCSTDHSRKVLKRLEPELPANYHIFYREKNMGMGENGNCADLYARTKGRYLINLEGDDYWIYDGKLQAEYDFLESHPEFLAVAHNCVVVDDDEKPQPDDLYPECKHAVYGVDDFIRGDLPGQTTTILFRNYYQKKYFDLRLLPSEYPGDRKRSFLLAVHGGVYCIQEAWSAYRHVTTHGSSFSATNKGISYQENRNYWYSLFDYLHRHPSLPLTRWQTARIEHRYLHPLLRRIILKRDATCSELLNGLRQTRTPCLSFGLLALSLAHDMVRFPFWILRRIFRP